MAIFIVAYNYRYCIDLFMYLCSKNKILVAISGEGNQLNTIFLDILGLGPTSAFLEGALSEATL